MKLEKCIKAFMDIAVNSKSKKERQKAIDYLIEAIVIKCVLELEKQ